MLLGPHRDTPQEREETKVLPEKESPQDVNGRRIEERLGYSRKTKGMGEKKKNATAILETAPIWARKKEASC